MISLNSIIAYRRLVARMACTPVLWCVSVVRTWHQDAWHGLARHGSTREDVPVQGYCGRAVGLGSGWGTAARVKQGVPIQGVGLTTKSVPTRVQTSKGIEGVWHVYG